VTAELEPWNLLRDQPASKAGREHGGRARERGKRTVGGFGRKGISGRGNSMNKGL
jgi:hypothetical protein